jgi:IS30 family transposase
MGRARFGGTGRAMPREVKLEIRDRLLAGETWVHVAAAIGICQGTIARVLNEAGGMPPRWSARSSSQLSCAQREDISLGLAAGKSYAQLGREIGCHRSTIKREVDRQRDRHDNPYGRVGYRAWRADCDAYQRARRTKDSKLTTNQQLHDVVEAGLVKHWSPRQISIRLVIDFPDDLEMRVSHETIYQSLFVQAKGGFRDDLVKCLRTGRTRRRAQSRVTRAGSIKDMVMISDRPAEIEDRAVPGHWEGDLILGRNNRSAIVTLVERSTRYLMMIALPDDHKAETVAAAIAKHITTLPAQLRRSITWDQGSEMAEHVKFTIATDIAVYFCDPHSPWQRGTNENTNGLIRQYFPKGTNLSVHPQSELDRVTDELNGRPRETLGGMTPSEKFTELVALTV